MIRNIDNIRGVKPSSHFKFKHAIHSEIAHNNKIDNLPGSDYNLISPIKELKTKRIETNLQRLFKYCINPIAKRFGRHNIALTSVYRNKAVNKIIGGVENSQHIFGYAADIILTDQTPTSTLFNWCAFNIPQYHQLIWEYPERGTKTESSVSFSWVHISYIKGDNPKINSLSSTDPKMHKAYLDENTFFIDNFTHNIATANQQLLEN